jgi:hypothetical protein
MQMDFDNPGIVDDRVCELQVEHLTGNLRVNLKASQEIRELEV